MSVRYKRKAKTRRAIEETLLNEEERAALRTIREEDDDQSESVPRCTVGSIITKLTRLCCNGAALSLVLMVGIIIIGITLFGLSHSTLVSSRSSSSNVSSSSSSDNTPVIMRHVSSFILYGGLFGLLSGLSNLFVIILLFYKIPLLYGSGVFIRKHRQISDVIRKVVMQMLFDSERLERYFIERINQYSIDTNISQSIADAMKSPQAQAIINDHLNELYSSPEAYYLVKLGITRDKVRPMIAPAVLSLCAETGPSVLGEFFNRNNSSGSVPEIREAMDNYLRYRVKDLTGQNISTYMKKIMFSRLSGLIVFGTIAGFIVGLMAQALRFTINPEFIIENINTRL